MPFLQTAIVGNQVITVFPVPIVVPVNVLNTSRENVVRMNLARRLESFSVSQLSSLLTEIEALLLLDPEWPVCLYSCGEANHAIVSAAEIAQAIKGAIEFVKAQASIVPPAPKPGIAEGVSSIALNRTLFWGGVVAVTILLANQFIGGTRRA
jgi:hypothetical protein